MTLSLHRKRIETSARIGVTALVVGFVVACGGAVAENSPAKSPDMAPPASAPPPPPPGYPQPGYPGSVPQASPAGTNPSSEAPPATPSPFAVPWNAGKGQGKPAREEGRETTPEVPKPPSLLLPPPAGEKDSPPPASSPGGPFADLLPIDVEAIQRSADAFFE